MKTNPPLPMPHALSWSDGLPYSTQFGDVYFSIDSGLDESRHVFHQHNNLAARWQALPNQGQFIIGETGFGTGLNFLAAVELWLHTAPESARLYYLTVEKYPLGKIELKQALALWPALSELSQELIAAYPDQLETEIYPLNLFGGRVQLLLTIDDATAGFNQQLHRQHPDFITPKTRVDAWFLDGFAPSKNADMWSQALFDTLAQLSHKDTTFSTYTCAGNVRRGLTHAGFMVAKQKGFGRKREMLSGYFCPQTTAEAKTPKASAPMSNQDKATPWQAFKLNPAGRHACVIGAGIAGCHTARALAESGWQVTVIEANAAPARMASGNAQGIVYAKLSPKRHPQGRFNITSLNYAQASYRAFWREQPEYGAACGVLQLAAKDETAEQQSASAATLPTSLAHLVTAQQASTLAGFELTHGGLHLPNAGWLNPPALCTWLLQHPSITVVFNTKVEKFALIADARWRIISPDNTEMPCFEADLVVLCCAEQAKHFPQTQHLPLKTIRGQITQLPATETSKKLKKVVTQEGYLAPTFAGSHCVGATFNLKLNDPAARDEDHETNLGFLAHLSNFYGRDLPAVSTLQGRVGFRCTSPDYLPLVGPVARETEMASAYALLAKNAKRVIASAHHYWPNLLVNLAHGSRGLAYTPICAQYIAALANKLPVPIRQDLCEALNPARFLIRDIARGKR
ncbi:bifunctional tRNA (5-methylaminomethyl-2-thiouridine)(34)-methyltransferase MnmD/FAD-dependent 5-carboxymethylaminomethyl-2-thiouridine(34) oxidoreductase MnmC [Simiduia litorea]|uniref:bifunctional tRNA (5-methylaminomethyl-2-thiouridine)(34)-methyltransferase MnmD/FAD-dependent 5-carboxymethylaminomethyl-2-thiouridine(34) oxidoreductase MnmC n=1 Tax=Simiduia litorea TaxID=1435348 RepID=UPI0036F2D1EB